MLPNILEPREMSGSITVNLDDLAPNSASLPNSQRPRPNSSDHVTDHSAMTRCGNNAPRCRRIHQRPRQGAPPGHENASTVSAVASSRERRVLFLIASKIGSGTPRRALARFARLRGERNLRPANFSILAVVAKNILVPAQDGTQKERIIGVADLRNRIWYYIYFFRRITKGKRSFFS
jgi:hypothetical protein